ncbi:MAG: riboflavin synthase [Gemmatimonadales bacterium]
MFTGLVTAVGRVEEATVADGGLDLKIGVDWTDLQLGESVAVDGACLTVKELGRGWFAAHVVTTSLARTCFAQYAVGRRVNLERALAIGDRLGGHLVQGHVDGVGTIVATRPEGDAWLVDLAVPPQVAEVSIPLGSITVDGVSLTVNAIPGPGLIQLSLIPFTLGHTTLGERRAGDAVHVEGDTVGKYVRQFTVAHRAAPEA